MSLFQTLSGLFQPGKKPAPVPTQEKRPVKVAPPRVPIKITPKAPPIRIDDSAFIREAQAKAREIILEARDEALKIRYEAEAKNRKIQDDFSQKQRELTQKETDVARIQAANETRERILTEQQTRLSTRLEEIEKLKLSYSKKIQEAARLSKDEAKDILFNNLEKRLQADMAKTIKAYEDKAHEEADEQAQEILVEALRHGATDYVSEYTVSTVKLPNEDSKGRIIGKEGRNIRAFEKITGVDVDLDETPGEVRLSSFDPVRREVAKMSLSRLLADGRIQPSRIEEYVAKAKTELEKIMFEEGKKLCHAVGVYNLPRDLIAMLGRFKFRFSYGQNMIAHTLEETKIGIALAQEVGADVDTVRLGCLLHDIGKVVTTEEGSHVELGVKLLKKYGIPPTVIDCVEQHHEDKPFSSSEAVLVYVSDAISGARPGARYENYDEYVKRLTKLEEIATSYDGVAEAYAIQAGREIRVIVKPEKIGDDGVTKLAFDIKERVRNEMTYPGTVTVTVIRETRASEVAK
jgi:ribonuclease Y